ncbi:MAG: hypothetical protein IPJ19_01005 [Planctomycetes bacterium]|nr:hypothetical protein [Planctomycetota bacterium]
MPNPEGDAPRPLAQRTLLALLLGVAGLALAGLDLRPQARVDGAWMVWSFWGRPAEWIHASMPAEPFATRAVELMPLLVLGALLLAALGGWLVARALRAPGEHTPGRLFTLGCMLACALALDPWVVVFVAQRQSFSAPRYLAIGDLFRALGIGLFALALLARLPRAPRELAPNPGTARGGLPLALAMLCAFALPTLVLPFEGEGPQLTNDEQAYLFQAELFARGEMADQLGPLADFFPSAQTQIEAGRIFSKYPPGHSAVLAPGVLAGWPLLVPRLLAALSVLLVWSLARRFGLARPVLAAWMFALSPALLGLESLALSQGTSLPLTLLFTWCALEALDRVPTRRAAALGFAALAGLSISIAFSARPVTAIAIALPVALLVLRERPRGWLKLAGCALLAALPAAIFFLCVNHALTGAALQTAYGRFNEAANSRFGAVAPAQALSIAAFNLGRLSFWVHGVAPGLLLAACGLARRPWPRRGWLLAALPASLFALYVLHPFQGIPWCGPVYLASSLPALALLSARGLELVEERRGTLALRVLACAGLAGSAWLLQQHFSLAREELELRNAPRLAARAAGIERGIVFVKLENAYARSRFALPPFEKGDALVFARDLGARDGELVHALGGVESWIYDPVERTLLRRPE